MFVLIWLQGIRYPWYHEWNLVPYLAHAQPLTWQWLWAQHVDHRILAIKVIYFVLYRIWPGDFRAPILFSAMLMCIASAMLIRTAKALRGDNSYVDAFFPLLMMHMGLGAWWWGMLMQFVLPTFLLCIVMSAWSTASIHINGFIGTRKVLGMVLPMILLPLSGSNGLVISVGVIALVILMLYWYWPELCKIPIIIVILCMGIAITLSIWFLYFFKFSTVNYDWGNLTPTLFLTTVGHVIVAPFGRFVSTYWLLALAALGLLILCLSFAIIRTFRS